MTTTANLQILPAPLESPQGLKAERQIAAGQQSLGLGKAETEAESRL
jgi:hypothetical protein